MSSSFIGGLVLGVCIGAGGVYAALEKPWKSDGTLVAVAEIADAGIVEGKQKHKRGKRRVRKGHQRNAEDTLPQMQEIDERIVLSAADRSLVWRGPKIVLPEKNLDMSGSSNVRTLDQSEINQGVGGRQNKLMSCISDARGQAELAAKITLKFLVDGNGRATKIRVRAPSYLIKHGLYGCASGVVRSMSFPSTGAATVVTVPFDLSF